MREYVLKTSLVSLATAALLFSGCQQVEELDSNSTTTDSSIDTTVDSSMSDRVKDVDSIQNRVENIVVDATTAQSSITANNTTSMPTPSKEHLALEEEYNQKLIDCYTSEVESCSNIISEMVDAQMELEMKEMMAQEELKIKQEMQNLQTKLPTQVTPTQPTDVNLQKSSEVTTQEVATKTEPSQNPTQGVSYAY